MHRNYFVIRRLAIALNEKLRTYVFDNAFSTGKNDLFLIFRRGNSFFHIRISFENSQVFFRFPAQQTMPGRVMPWYREAWGAEVHEVVSSRFDRLFTIRFKNDLHLAFKLYAPKPDVVLGGKDLSAAEAFRSRKNADEPVTDDRPPELILPEKELSDEKGLLALYPYFKGEIAEKLAAGNFYKLDKDKQSARLQELWTYLLDPKFYTGKSGEQLKFSIYEFSGAFVFHDVVKALDRFSADYLREYHLSSSKDQLIKAYEAELRKLQKSLQASAQRLLELQSEVPLDEKANILMANLHRIESGLSEVVLHDFYRDREIKLKLNPRLNGQQNAELLYRKAKNRHIEEDALKQKAESLRASILEFSEKLDLIRSTTDRQLLKSLSLRSKHIAEDEHQPYRAFECMGWSILVGKSAKSNDELISVHAKKNDIWLHARNFAGSHVVIKMQAGKVLPKPVLEKAASLAAWFSKGKSESLCPVIYTERKFVRKPKGATPGQVLVEKEQVIMVKPAL